MKKILLTILLFSTALNAQNSTTEEEYNYLIKGYKIQKESGIDTEKKGYVLKEDQGIKYKGISNNYTFRAFYSDDTKKIKGIMIIASSNTSRKEMYFAIPFNNTELFKRFQYDVSIQSESVRNEIFSALSNWTIIQQFHLTSTQ